MNIALRRVEQRDWEGFSDYLRDADVRRFLGARNPEQQFGDLCQRETNGPPVFAIVEAWSRDPEFREVFDGERERAR